MGVIFRVVIFYGLFVCSSIFAAEVPDLYETEVLAKSQSADDRNRAIKEALTIVLKRVVAGSDFFNDRAVKAVLANAQRYVKEYQYSLTEVGADSNRFNNSTRNMRVLFDEQSLLNVIKTGNLKIWSETRPDTLVWLVVEENGRRAFFKQETMPVVNFAISNLSEITGLPLLFPIMDLDEQRQLSVDDVLSAYPQNLLAVSERYGVVSILAGRVVKAGSCWKADWAFYFDRIIDQWTKSCGTLNDVVLTGLQGVYDKLSKYYAVKPYFIEMNIVTLKISGILGMEERDRVEHYLKSLKMVKSADWLNSYDGRDVYRVKYEGKMSDLTEIIGLGRVLDPQDNNMIANELGYRLLPKRFR